MPFSCNVNFFFYLRNFFPLFCGANLFDLVKGCACEHTASPESWLFRFPFIAIVFCDYIAIVFCDFIAGVFSEP